MSLRMARSLAIDESGNLYVAIGDNTGHVTSRGLTPLDEYEGRRAWDVQGASGDTSHLRDKVLRIRRRETAGISFPEDNLFHLALDKTLAKIYAMVLRDPLCIATNPHPGVPLVADYGADARAENPNRGP
jgi:glucose/arabinose dehydrogenase